MWARTSAWWSLWRPCGRRSGSAVGGLVLHLLHQTPLETPKSSALLWLQLEHSSRHTSPFFLYLQLLIACTFDFSLHLSKDVMHRASLAEAHG